MVKRLTCSPDFHIPGNRDVRWTVNLTLRLGTALQLSISRTLSLTHELSLAAVDSQPTAILDSSNIPAIIA